MTWFVYIVNCSKGLYCGITTDINRRLTQHSQNKGAKFFNGVNKLNCVYIEVFPNRSEASQREYAIKKMSHKQKSELIANNSEFFNKFLLTTKIDKIFIQDAQGPKISKTNIN